MPRLKRYRLTNPGRFLTVILSFIVGGRYVLLPVERNGEDIEIWVQVPRLRLAFRPNRLFRSTGEEVRTSDSLAEETADP